MNRDQQIGLGILLIGLGFLMILLVACAPATRWLNRTHGPTIFEHSGEEYK